jgi:hypothetical protein
MGVVVQNSEAILPPCGAKARLVVGIGNGGHLIGGSLRARVVGEAFLAPPVFVAAVLDGELR